MGYVNPWTDERVTSLKELAADGFSAGMIARTLGNVTRNGVMGKLNRLGVRLRTKRLDLEADAATDLPPDTSPDACSLMELTDTSCRYPLGDPATPEFRFCGTARPDGATYCNRHARIIYIRKDRYHHRDGR